MIDKLPNEVASIMEFLHSFTGAFQTCLRNKRFSVAHLHAMSKKNMDIDSQGCYKIFFSLSGQKIFHIDGQPYICLPGDVLLISPQQWHYFSDFGDEQDHERIILFIYPTFLKECCTADTDLGYCFSQARSHGAYKLSLSPSEQKYLLGHISRLRDQEGFGQDILDNSIFLEALVYLNRIFIEHSRQHLETDTVPSHNYPQVNEILSYINHHLCEDLSTGILAERFFLSPSYLCKLFRAATGTTLHKYVVAKRVTLAKNLLADGMSVSATCAACGFNDYSNFIKIFTKSVGVSPKKYANLQKES